ncbi:hypothetical protein CCAX7_25340 [Capsulimonas corticalis]|uniref:Uncharacterized protein n=1 Tax=Capsulimonas corticalis TaxID=2219043 RepID=A0A402CVP0_9BACT|nr:GntR family transcriptional regulator [Capsulimonas corticalis]BDI30483.1 hypothetical protein CCAX7_25340 [Capsulimonas corticalis]
MTIEFKPRKYERLASELRDLIRGGSLKPGDQLPTFAELHLKSGITKPTIIRAHTLLEREGLITRRRGHGTFVAEPAAGAAAGPMTDTIAVFTPYGGVAAQRTYHSPGWAIHTTAGVLERVSEAGKHAILLHPDRVTERDIEWLTTQRTLGAIVYGENELDVAHLQMIISSFVKAGVPIAEMDQPPGSVVCDRVESDHEQGAYELTQWLIARGRRRILPIMPLTDEFHWGARRIAGYERAMREAGLAPMAPIGNPVPGDAPVTRAEFDAVTRTRAATLIEVMVGDDACDALLLATDGLVFSYAAACRMFGRQPNRDVLLAGYDNYWEDAPEREAGWETARPDITVDKDNHRIGAELVQLLLDRLEGRLPSEPQLRMIPPKVIVLSDAVGDPKILPQNA